MKTSAAVLSAFLLLGTASQALAAATPEEAQRLASVFQAYLGPEPGVVTVTPSGDSYAAKFDLAPLFAKIKEPGASAMVTPIEWTLTDQGGGKWKVDQNQPFAFAFKAEGQVDMTGSFGAINGTGVFDEALGAFASAKTDFKQFAFEQTLTEQGKTSKINYTIDGIAAESAMSGSETSADGTAKYSYTGLRETISMPGAPDGSMPPMDLSIESPSGTQDGAVKGMRPKALLGVFAWLVEHPSKEAVIAGQKELKDKLYAALPVFNSASGTMTMNGLTVNSLLGKFGAAKVDVEAGMNGIVADGQIREKFTFTGFTMPDGVVPPWAQNLVPQNFTIDIGGSGFDLTAPAKLILDNLDLSKDPPLPNDIEPKLAQAILPKGAVDITLGASEIIAKVFDLKADGSMTAGPAAMPAGQATVRLKGIDDIMAAVQSAPPEMGLQQMAPMIIVAKGMAKQESDGYLSWKIETTPAGGVTVNGVDPMKMGGQ